MSCADARPPRRATGRSERIASFGKIRAFLDKRSRKNRRVSAWKTHHTPTLQNVVGCVPVGSYPVRLRSVVEFYEFAVCVLGEFPAAIMRITVLRLPVVVLIFESGKIVINGTRTEQHLLYAAHVAFGLLRDCGALHPSHSLVVVTISNLVFCGDTSVLIGEDESITSHETFAPGNILREEFSSPGGPLYRLDLTAFAKDIHTSRYHPRYFPSASYPPPRCALRDGRDRALAYLTWYHMGKGREGTGDSPVVIQPGERSAVVVAYEGPGENKWGAGPNHPSQEDMEAGRAPHRTCTMMTDSLVGGLGITATSNWTEAPSEALPRAPATGKEEYSYYSDEDEGGEGDGGGGGGNGGDGGGGGAHAPVDVVTSLRRKSRAQRHARRAFLRAMRAFIKSSVRKGSDLIDDGQGTLAVLSGSCRLNLLNCRDAAAAEIAMFYMTRLLRNYRRPAASWAPPTVRQAARLADYNRVFGANVASDLVVPTDVIDLARHAAEHGARWDAEILLPSSAMEEAERAEAAAEAEAEAVAARPPLPAVDAKRGHSGTGTGTGAGPAPKRTRPNGGPDGTEAYTMSFGPNGDISFQHTPPSLGGGNEATPMEYVRVPATQPSMHNQNRRIRR